MSSSQVGEFSSHSNPPDEKEAWIEKNLYKRECIKFAQDEKNTSKCVCGRLRSVHPNLAEGVLRTAYPVSERWSFTTHTDVSPTDAHGTIEFQGGPHPTKAQYVRLAFDTPPEKILQLLNNHWNLDIPKLLISVHGGIANFDLQPKLRRVCKQGLFSAAKTAGAWITTGGTNSGVMRHVGEALGDTLVQSRNNIVTIGFAPWGVVHKREDLVGKNTVVPYHAISLPGSDNIVLNSSHSYFLLVDDGSVGKFGCETVLRKSLEKFISQPRVNRNNHKEDGTPVVCLLMEGGSNCIRTVLECVTDNPPIPVVIVDGSGRASDLLAFTHKHAQSDGTIPDVLKEQLLTTIAKTFMYSPAACSRVFSELMLCTKKKSLVTVFRIGEGNQDIDQAILTTLLKSQNVNSLYQLNLTMAWNRVDMARNHIFSYGHLWPEGALDHAMMDALVSDRIDFVKLLIENGVNMTKWLTITRLEDLYNQVLNAPRPIQVKRVQFASARAKVDSTSTLRHLLTEHKRSMSQNYRFTLYDIGQVMNKLMGGAYQSTYCRRKFRLLHHASKNKGIRTAGILDGNAMSCGFRYPYSELMVWAVLLRRQKMAMFMWERGEESLAKCLIAAKLYKSMIREAEEDEYEIDVANEISLYHQEFFDKALELLDHCYKTDDNMTQFLLTYELNSWGNQTCLSLAVAGSNRKFIAHTCCQILLTQMWMGGLRTRKYPSLKVLSGIFCFPLIIFFKYRTKEELEMMPQTHEEYKEHCSSDVDSAGSDTDLSEEENNFPVPPTAPAEVAVDLSTAAVDDGATIKNANNQSENNLLQKQNSVMRSTKARQKSIGSLERSASRKRSKSKLNLAEEGAKKEDQGEARMHMSQLHIGQKIFEFYTAPITKFWLHTMGYCLFVLLFIYLMLMQTPNFPSPLEWYISSYMVGLLFEKLREFITSEPTKFKQKVRVFVGDGWNVVDIVSLILYLAGFILRFNPDYILYARNFYSLTVAIAIVRIVEFFVISPHLGPFVHILGKMIKEFLFMMVFVLVSMISFGTFRIAVWYPDNEFDWASVREIFLKPYFMLYGEVYHEIVWPDCMHNITGTTDNNQEFKCVPGRWMVPVALSIYLAFGIIVLLSLVIAVFNNVFVNAYAHSNAVWKFQRYLMVIEYESRPLLPSPFIIISHIILLTKFVIRKCTMKHNKFDQGLKMFLQGEDLEKLHDFEEECMEIYHREKLQTALASEDFSVRQTAERLERACTRLDDIQQRENSISQHLLGMQIHMNKIEDHLYNNSCTLWMLQQQMQKFKNLSSLDAVDEQAGMPNDPPNSDPACLASLKSSRELMSAVEAPPGCSFNPAPEGSNFLRQRKGSGVKGSPAPFDHGRTGSCFVYHRTSEDELPRHQFPVGGRHQHPVKKWFHFHSNSEQESLQAASHETCVTPSFSFPSKSASNAPPAPGLRRYPFVPLTPIVTPMRVDYTSITDEIDTSFLIDTANSSPPDTPPPYPRSFLPILKRPKHKRKKKPLIMTTSRSIDESTLKESDRLKEAEENVNKQLTTVVKRRIRQMSLTEPDNEFCNIAMNALKKLENQDDEDNNCSDAELQSPRLGGRASTREEGRIFACKSQEEIASSPERQNSTKLKFIQSEPSIKAAEAGTMEMSRLLTLREDEEEATSISNVEKKERDDSPDDADAITFKTSQETTSSTYC